MSNNDPKPPITRPLTSLPYHHHNTYTQSAYDSIDKCLKLSPKHSNIETKELVIMTKNTTMHNFLTNMNQRNIVKVKEQFIDKISDMNGSAEQIIGKKTVQCKEILNEIGKYKVLNQQLEDDIADINNKYKLIELELRDSNEEIHKMQMTSNNSEKVKPLFESLVKAFPNEDPLQLVTDIISKRDKNISMIFSINSLEENIEKVCKDMTDEEHKYQKIMEDLNKKLIQSNLDSKAKTEKYKKEMMLLSKDLETSLLYEKNNIQLRDILFKLYLHLLDRLKSVRGMTIDDHFLKADYKSFKPQWFNDDQLLNLVNKMLETVDEDHTMFLLRKTIAYANMMARIYLSDKKYLRYDPLKTLIEIKAFNDKTEFENSSLISLQTVLQVEDKENQQKIMKLKNELKRHELIYDSLKKRIERQFSDNIFSKNKPRSKSNHKKSKRKKNKSKNKSSTPDKKFFLTDTLEKRYENKNMMGKANSIKKPAPKSANVTESSIYELSNENSSDSSTLGNDFVAKETDIKKFKDIKVSKNKDKLIKSNGYKGIGSFLTGLKNLVDKTNRMEYYHNRIQTTTNKMTLSNQLPMLSPTDREKEKNKTAQQFYHKDRYDTLSKKVMQQINTMITSTGVNTTENV